MELMYANFLCFTSTTCSPSIFPLMVARSNYIVSSCTFGYSVFAKEVVSLVTIWAIHILSDYFYNVSNYWLFFTYLFSIILFGKKWSVTLILHNFYFRQSQFFFHLISLCVFPCYFKFSADFYKLVYFNK